MKQRRVVRIIAVSLLTFVLMVIAGLVLSATGIPNFIRSSNSKGLVVHEWGTFTSIAGKDGVALEWRPLTAPTDLPKFVHTIQNQNNGLRHANSKAELAAAIRMETPVLYFYSPSETEVSVNVNFPKGKITEWYPQARSVDTTIDWGRLKVIPGATMNLPVEYSASHYYAARETEAAQVQVCATNGKKPEQEKFLFYRGVGTFELPLKAKLAGENIVLTNSGEEPITHLIVFENRGGKIGYSILNEFTGETNSDRPSLDRNLDSLLADLKQALVSSGLYEKEANAMIKTWRDSWFEPGMRVFYILPRSTTDAVLPINIEPRPEQLVRVLVGRAELITPEMEKNIKAQISKLGNPSPTVRARALDEIKQYGRFSEPILKSILETEQDRAVRAQIEKLLATPSEW